MGLKITKDNVPQLLAALKRMTAQEVLVGIPEENAARDPEPGEKGTPATNALIGYVMEYGSPANNIPARPFLVPGVESVRDKIIVEMRKAGDAAMDARFGEVETRLNRVGLIAQAAVQQKIVDGPFAPLAPATIKRRIENGRTGTSPLIDTGALRQSITYVIRNKGK